MAIVDLLMPKMGESIMEATILKWNKKPGESVLLDESLLDIATDKVDSEVPSTAAGVLKEILLPENAVVPVGAVIAKIETEVHAGSPPDAGKDSGTVQHERPQSSTVDRKPVNITSTTSEHESSEHRPLLRDGNHQRK